MSTRDTWWEAIADRAIEQAEAVDCTLAEFAHGLGVIEGEIAARRMGAEDEAKYDASPDDKEDKEDEP